MVCNAVVTAQRTRYFITQPDTITPCRACDSSKDHIDHYYDGTCEVAVAARSEFGIGINYDLTPTYLDTDYKQTSYLMINAPHSTELPAPAHAQGTARGLWLNRGPAFLATIHAIAIFNWAFWLALVKYFPEGGANREQVVKKVLKIAHSAWGRTRNSAWRQQLIQHRNHHYHTSTKLGSTSNRTRKQKEKARSIAEKRIQQVPANAVIIFTDGSGPSNSEDCAGAGVVVLMPRHRREGAGGCLKANAAFDEGTNNIGEMWAIGMGLQLALYDINRTGEQLTGGIYVFSDSALSVDIIAHLAVPRSNRELCHAVRRLANSINRHYPININWIAGHVGIEGNEIADQEAEKGKQRARKGRGINKVQYTSQIFNSQFLPTGQEPFMYYWKPP
jgi:ribonuclease HI